MSKAPRSRIARITVAAVLAVASTVGATTVLADQASAASPFERGPDPTRASIEATRGPFATTQVTVSRSGVSGFGGATIYYPSSTTTGTFGGVAIVPGFTARQSSISWLGPRLASQGFVVMTIDTLRTGDQPAARGDQLLAALDYLTQRSSVRTLVDPDRLAVMGHSMGGGGTLDAAKDRTALKAAVSLTGWNSDKSWPEVKTPSLIIGAQNDGIASVRSHSLPFYNGLPAGTPKVLLELRGASHFTPNRSNTTIAKYSISWLKLHVDADTRYSQFICPAPTGDTAISQYRSTCPS